MSRSLLNPCICGSKRRKMIRTLNVLNLTYYKVRCHDCGRETTLQSTREEAIIKWNGMTGSPKED